MSGGARSMTWEKTSRTWQHQEPDTLAATYSWLWSRLAHRSRTMLTSKSKHQATAYLPLISLFEWDQSQQQSSVASESRWFFVSSRKTQRSERDSSDSTLLPSVWMGQPLPESCNTMTWKMGRIVWVKQLTLCRRFGAAMFLDVTGQGWANCIPSYDWG